MIRVNNSICLIKSTIKNDKGRLLGILKFLNEKLDLPNPQLIETTTEYSRQINAWDFSEIEKYLEIEDRFLILKNTEYNVAFSIFPDFPKIQISINPNTYPEYLKISEKDLFIDIATQLSTTIEYIVCEDIEVSKTTYEDYIEFTEWERTPRNPFLGWLQYYNHDELKRQGGDAIFENPYIKAERLCGGILIQVGESLEEAYSPEGQELLVKATKAMPPVQRI